MAFFIKNFVKTYRSYSSFCKLPVVVYSGIQPTGIPHIGNYLGAINNWAKLQDETGTHIYCVVDLHSITIPKNKETTSRSIYNMLACLLSCGLDPKKSIIYKQSDVLEHTQLFWILNTLTPTARLNRFPQWKEKKAQLGDNTGLFSYPVLQSADILLYNTTHVPIGDDQSNHINLTNELVEKFNKTYGSLFHKVEILKDESFNRILSLRDPTSKMSKSSTDKHATVYLDDEDDVIHLKIRRAVTDMKSEVTYDPKTRPGVSNLIRIHSGFSGLSVDEICAKNSHLNTGQYKRVVSDAVVECIRPIRNKYFQLKEEQNYLDEIFKNGALQAKDIASKKWMQVREHIGLSR